VVGSSAVLEIRWRVAVTVVVVIGPTAGSVVEITMPGVSLDTEDTVGVSSMLWTLVISAVDRRDVSAVITVFGGIAVVTGTLVGILMVVRSPDGTTGVNVVVFS
jgi:hypothetical protein